MVVAQLAVRAAVSIISKGQAAGLSSAKIASNLTQVAAKNTGQAAAVFKNAAATVKTQGAAAAHAIISGAKR